jgi:hypothetical protein
LNRDIDSGGKVSQEKSLPIILILDSDTFTADLIRLTLQGGPFEIVTFSYHSQALAFLKDNSEKISQRVRILVIADPMPGITAEDLVSQARETIKNPGIIILDSLGVGAIPAGDTMPARPPEPLPGPQKLEGSLKIAKPLIMGTLLKAIAILCPECSNHPCPENPNSSTGSSTQPSDADNSGPADQGIIASISGTDLF